MNVYLVKEAVDLCECVCNWQVKKLGKVPQTQPFSLLLSGSSGLLLQHFLCSACSQPVDEQCTSENTNNVDNSVLQVDDMYQKKNVCFFCLIFLASQCCLHYDSIDSSSDLLSKCIRKKLFLNEMNQWANCFCISNCISKNTWEQIMLKIVTIKKQYML